MAARGIMLKSSTPEKAVLFLNNLAGDDLWEHGHDMLPEYQRTHIPHELFKYKPGLKNARKSGVSITSAPYQLKGYGKIQIYGFPFLSIAVDPLDIEYPNPIHGLVITEDMRMFDYLMEQKQGLINTADPHFSRLAWAKNQSLPTVLAVHHADGHSGDFNKLTTLVGMEIFCPVIWHTGELNASFLNKAVETVFSEIKQF
jgi:hypothetical protein